MTYSFFLSQIFGLKKKRERAVDNRSVRSVYDSLLLSVDSVGVCGCGDICQVQLSCTMCRTLSTILQKLDYLAVYIVILRNPLKIQLFIALYCT